LNLIKEKPMLTDANVQDRSRLQSFAASTTEDRFRLLVNEWRGQLVASTSFGIQSSVMLHLISRYAPGTPVVFIDTGFLFPETYRHAENLADLLDINLHVYSPKYSASRIQALWGKLWEQGEVGEARYAHITKIEPMQRALGELGARVWMSGLRRSQSQTRKGRAHVEQQEQIIKAYPILDWSDQQVAQYCVKHNLPAHPLREKGYVTSGDVHSTKPLTEVANAEETRFGGRKYECGLHLSPQEPVLAF
jgi:phosphoadenosine phosphosulfate reductase